MKDNHEEFCPSQEDWDDYDAYRREQDLEEEWDELTCQGRFPPFSE